MTKKSIVGALLLAGFGLASSASHALTLSSGSSSNSFSWIYNTGGSLLTGTGSITASGFNGSELTLAISLINTSQARGERLVGFAFGIDPNATSVMFVDNDTTGMRSANFVSTGVLASEVPGVEICAWGGSNCSGGMGTGIYGQGGRDDFSIRLAGTWGSSVTIDPIGLRYQTGYGSFTFPTPGNNVPEPGPMALFAIGLVSLGLRRRLAATGGSAAAA